MEDKQKLINKIFRLLPLYESAVKNKTVTTSFLPYLTRVRTELSGIAELYDSKNKLLIEEIVSILSGVQNLEEELTHKEIRQLTFYMIGQVDKYYES